jgi:class 3 adenylate cyclase
VAVLAADIVGYSRLMEADEEDTHKRVLLLRATIIDPTIAKYRGQVIKNTGDGFLAAFDSANDASQCALAIQHGANAMSAEEPEHRFISLRMGINVADAIFEREDMNIAARLQTYSEPGGIVVSGAVADQISEQAGVSVVDFGDLHLRNLSRPVKAFGLRIELHRILWQIVRSERRGDHPSSFCHSAILPVRMTPILPRGLSTKSFTRSPR